MGNPLCEVCGASAVVMVNDLIALDPIRDEKGRSWACWRLHSSHALCQAHQRLWQVASDERRDKSVNIQEVVQKMHEAEIYAMSVATVLTGLAARGAGPPC